MNDQIICSRSSVSFTTGEFKMTQFIFCVKVENRLFLRFGRNPDVIPQYGCSLLCNCNLG